MADLITRIENALAEHLPEHSKRNAEFAVLFAAAVHHSSGGYSVAKVDSELARIDDLERACRSAQDAFRSLHSNARTAMRQDAANRRADLSFHPPALRRFLDRLTKRLKGRRHGLSRSWPAPSPPEALKQLNALHDALAPSFDAARDAIRRAEDAGQIDWRRIAAVEDVRKHWTACTGKRAPRSVNVATPFGLYAQAIFDTADLGSAKGAFDAWRKSADRRER